ncbi:TPA: type II secretion system inner membrane protein GspF [Escherichia coli]
MVPVAQETTANTVRLPYSFSRRFSLVAWCEASLEILHVHPLSLSVLQELQRGLNAPFTLRQIDEAEFEQRLNAVWQRDSSEARQLMEDLGSAEDFFTLAEELPETEDLLESDDDAPIIKLINAMLAEAIKEGASDIHIETFEKSLVIRFRVDGTLHEMLRPGRKLASLLVSRIKVMARLDIAEKRVPQDGRIALLLGGRAIDVRVSTMPSAWGERVVLRLLDKNQARQLLRGKELIPVHIEARMNTSSGGMLQRRRHAHRRVAAADLALFTRQLATLVQAAMPLETCLQAVSEQSEKLHVKSLGMALRSRIQEGYTLSDSLREHPRVFDSLFCSMVAAGEKSGHLDVVLNRLADYTEQRQRLKSRLLQAMLYPLVLLVVATGVVTILLTAVVPKIIEQFDHLGHALPASTRTLIAMSDALQASGVYWLAGLLGLLVLGQRLLKNPAMRLRWDQTVLRLPVTGRVARGLNTARFSRTLSILTASSVPLLEGIQTAAAVSANRYVEQQLLLAADRVREGSSLRAALAELRLFPPMMLYMIASGEQSGELETMLEQAAVNQEREFDTQVGLALGLFEPALVVMMAGVVLFIVIAILEPMLQLNNMVGM